MEIDEGAGVGEGSAPAEGAQIEQTEEVRCDPSLSERQQGTDWSVPWVEKYRPLFLRDVVGNQDTIERLVAVSVDGNLPNLILAGPPGTGKTTSIMCLARALLGAAMKDALLELNASDDRNIDVVRNKIKMFAQKKVTLPRGRHKIVILDEADSMTDAAQQALRRTMELHSSTTRFALACNQSDKIIEPIQSRCAILRFSKLSDTEVLERVMEVIRQETVAYNNQGLEAILFTAEGDMRQALNNLQATHVGFGMVNWDNVFKVCDRPPPVTVRAIVDCALAQNLAESHRLLGDLVRRGYAIQDIMGTLFSVTKNNVEMAEELKLAVVREIGLTQLRVVEGVDTFLQLSGLIARVALAGQRKK